MKRTEGIGSGIFSVKFSLHNLGSARFTSQTRHGGVVFMLGGKYQRRQQANDFTHDRDNEISSI